MKFSEDEREKLKEPMLEIREAIDDAEFDRHIQIARDELGDAGFDVLASEGRAMTLEQAVEYALRFSGSR